MNGWSYVLSGVNPNFGSDKERVLLCLVNDRLVGLGQVLFQMKRVLF